MGKTAWESAFGVKTLAYPLYPIWSEIVKIFLGSPPAGDKRGAFNDIGKN